MQLFRNYFCWVKWAQVKEQNTRPHSTNVASLHKETDFLFEKMYVSVILAISTIPITIFKNIFTLFIILSDIS